MQFWIDKEQEKRPDAEWQDAYVFSINREKYSTIFTNIANSWYQMDQLQIPAIYEDLFIIGLSILLWIREYPEECLKTVGRER